ncbi:MAG TPA: uroporphyrinogen-III synthase [Gemmatimonadales bacterium]|nr:uroporphyrinogen-III synthase [Gemmatimonadales bacterium]
MTRAREQAGELMRELEALGADVVSAPTIRIEALQDQEPLRRALTRLAQYRWVVFTSQNAVQVVCDRLETWGLSLRDFTGRRIAAIGPATAEALAARGIRVDVLPQGYVAESLVEALASDEDLRGARVLIPRAEAARDALPEGLESRGAVVDVIPVYRTLPALPDGASLAGDILAGRIDVVTFTASSTVRYFVESVGPDVAASGRFRGAAIGPITAATAREYGIPVTIEAREYTTAGLVDALVQYFGGRERGMEEE